MISKYKNERRINSKHIFFAMDILMIILLITLFTSVTIDISNNFKLSLMIIDIVFISTVYILINLIKTDKRRAIIKVVVFSLLLFSAYADISSYKWYTQTFKYYEISNFPILIRTFRIGFKISLIDIFTIISVIAFLVFYGRLQFKLKEYRLPVNLKHPSSKVMLTIVCLPIIYTLSLLFIVSTNNYEYYYSDAFLVKEVYSNEEYISRFGYSQYRLRKLFPKITTSTNYSSDLEEYYNRDYTKATNEYTNKYEGYNVITLQVESLDLRLLNEYTMPNLYNLYNNSILINDYFVPEYQQGASCNSEFMAQTSLYPYTGNDVTNIMCKEIYDFEITNSLARTMSNLGYETHYYHNGTSSFYNRNKIIPTTYGYDNYGFSMSVSGANKADSRDSTMMQFVDNVDFNELFYMNFFTYNMHAGAINYDQESYDYIQEHLGPLSDDFLIDYYYEQMKTDEFIGLLIDRLKDENVYDNTLIYIYSDHYPYGADGTVYDFFNQFNIEYKSINEAHRQQLIIHDGGQTVTEYTISSSTIDIAPTIFNMVSDNSTIDYRYYFGNDIFDELSLVSFSNYDIYYQGEFYSFTTKNIPIDIAKIHLDNYYLRNMNDYAIRTRNKTIINK